MRRAVLVVLAVLATAVPLTACGNSARSGSHHRVFNAAVCAYSVWRGTHDARTHHYGFAAFQLWLALHHCPRVFHH